MGIDVNYRQLQLARESRGYTQTNLAKSISGLSQSNLSKMEKGLLPIGPEVLSCIAKKLQYPIEFFYKKSQLTPVGSLHYRKRLSLSKSALMLIESKRDIVRMIVDDLSQSVEIKECTIPHISVTDSMTPNDIAFRIRQYMQIPKGPIQNLISHLEDMGIIVYEMEFNTDKLMGFTVYTDTCQPIIFINVSMPNDRKRFTLGHELGHIVMHLNIDTNDDDKEIEHQADAFASEFLMPILDCIEDIRYFRIKRLDELKAYWKVSKAAIIKRALTAKVITEDKYKYFMIELSRMGERKTERGFVPLDKPTLLRQMVEMHINELNYTKTELAQILGLSESDCDSYLYMNASPRRLQLRLG